MAKRRKGLAKHLRKKRAKKLLNALCEAGIPKIDGKTTTALNALSIGDAFSYEGKEYTVADAEVAGYIAVIDSDGNQEWLPCDIAV